MFVIKIFGKQKGEPNLCHFLKIGALEPLLNNAKKILGVFESFAEIYFFVIQNRKKLCKRKLISFKKWLRSTDSKKMAKV